MPVRIAALAPGVDRVRVTSDQVRAYLNPPPSQADPYPQPGHLTPAARSLVGALRLPPCLGCGARVGEVTVRPEHSPSPQRKKIGSSTRYALFLGWLEFTPCYCKVAVRDLITAGQYRELTADVRREAQAGEREEMP